MRFEGGVVLREKGGQHSLIPTHKTDRQTGGQILISLFLLLVLEASRNKTRLGTGKDREGGESALKMGAARRGHLWATCGPPLCPWTPASECPQLPARLPSGPGYAVSGSKLNRCGLTCRKEANRLEMFLL